MEQELFKFKSEEEAQWFINSLQIDENMSDQQANMIVIDDTLSFVTTSEEALVELSETLDKMSERLSQKLDNLENASQTLKQLVKHDYDFKF